MSNIQVIRDELLIDHIILYIDIIQPCNLCSWTRSWLPQSSCPGETLNMSNVQVRACHARAAFPEMCAWVHWPCLGFGTKQILLRTRAKNLHPDSLGAYVTEHSWEGSDLSCNWGTRTQNSLTQSSVHRILPIVMTCRCVTCFGPSSLDCSFKQSSRDSLTIIQFLIRG